MRYVLRMMMIKLMELWSNIFSRDEKLLTYIPSIFRVSNLLSVLIIVMIQRRILEGNHFMLLVYFETKDLFKEMRKQLYEYKQSVLIYASWNNNQTTIKTKTQIVPLKER